MTGRLVGLVGNVNNLPVGVELSRGFGNLDRGAFGTEDEQMRDGICHGR